MIIVELPEGTGYAHILEDGKYFASIWLDENNYTLGMSETKRWFLCLENNNVFIHADAIRRR